MSNFFVLVLLVNYSGNSDCEPIIAFYVETQDLFVNIVFYEE